MKHFLSVQEVKWDSSSYALLNKRPSEVAKSDDDVSSFQKSVRQFQSFFPQQCMKLLMRNKSICWDIHQTRFCLILTVHV